jgi:hypothetical protein
VVLLLGGKQKVQSHLLLGEIRQSFSYRYLVTMT